VIDGGLLSHPQRGAPEHPLGLHVRQSALQDRRSVLSVGADDEPVHMCSHSSAPNSSLTTSAPATIPSGRTAIGCEICWETVTLNPAGRFVGAASGVSSDHERSSTLMAPGLTRVPGAKGSLQSP